VDKDILITPCYHVPHLEWEFFPSELTISNLSFENTNWGFNNDATIKVSRNPFTFKIYAEISGSVSTHEGLDHAPYVGVANIVEGQCVWGRDSSENTIELQGCFLGSFKTSSLNIQHVEAEVTIEHLEIHYAEGATEMATSRLEWFVCGEFSAHLWHRTLRNLKLQNKKIRIGLDPVDEDDIANWIGGSSSKDFTPVHCNGVDFLLAKVPKGILREGTTGVCFEFRQDPEGVGKDLLNSISGFLSFLLGNELVYIGNSILAGQKLKSANFKSRNIEMMGHAMPPIHYNTEYEWGDLSKVLNRHLPVFLQVKDQYCLEDALSRYWIARQTPLGANLPVLSSALEIMAAGYLRKNKEAISDYLPEKEYLCLIAEELESLVLKFEDIDGGKIMLNKIKGAFRKGINEKMTLFFAGINIVIGTEEKEALQLRNKMTHSVRDYSEDKRVYQDLKLTRVYEMLFHRVLLAVIGYTDYYKDYSIGGCPSKRVNKPAGKK